jgi:ferredoxin--NADP+ reductase
VHDALLPGKRLWFLPLARVSRPSPACRANRKTYEDYDEIIITRTCREVGELTVLIEGLKTDESMRSRVLKKIKYYPTTTREHSPKMAGLTDLMVRCGVCRSWRVRAEPRYHRAMRSVAIGVQYHPSK